MKHAVIFGLVVGVFAGPLAAAPWGEARYFPSGAPIYQSGYCDQPYVVALPEGAWLCAFTTGAGAEGAGGQHVVATRSTDQGATWTAPVAIEPPDGPAASWAMPFVTDFGRVYVFYDYNGDTVDHLPGAPEKKIRDDMLGWYCFKYSDDGGRSWSARHRLPVRVTACDRANQWAGAVQVLWGIGKPQRLAHGEMIFGFTKLGKYMLDNGEGWFFRCDTINTEKDPAKLVWHNLPEGDHGLRHPDFGSVQEEHNLVQLNDGSLYCVYRTAKGFIAYSRSTDLGATWSTPAPVRYADGGDPLPNPRACPRLFKCRNGRYLLWYENNHSDSFSFRNPAWISGGVESAEGQVAWSQPEILIYSDDTSYHTGRFSYPDLIEAEGRYWVTCTNKVEARLFPVDAGLLNGLWAQCDTALAAAQDLPAPMWQWRSEGGEALVKVDPLVARGYWLDPAQRAESLSLRMTLWLKTLAADQVLLDARDTEGRGLLLHTDTEARLVAVLKGEGAAFTWRTDEGRIQPGHAHRLTLIFDNGPGILLGLVDGRLCDGDAKEWGWRHYRDLDAVQHHMIRKDRPAPRSLGRMPLNADGAARIAGASVQGLAVYDRALRVSEVVLLDQLESRVQNGSTPKKAR